MTTKNVRRGQPRAVTARRSRLASLIATAAIAAVLVGGDAAADEEEPALIIEPGQWRFQTVSKMPMSAQAQTRTIKECIVDGRRTARQLTKGSARSCKFSDVVVNASTMKWRMICNEGGGKLTGEAEFHSKKTSVEGTMQMQMEHGGMKLGFERSMTGERIGDCEA